MTELRFFTPDIPVFRASAPGRMDVMGGIADYSGSLVLQMPIRERTTVSVALRDDFLLRIQSQLPGQHPRQFSVDYRDVLVNGREVDYTFARDMLRQLPGGDWASYPVGCLLALQKEKGAPVTGADILIESEVPLGKGVSSSAALEVATLKALQEAYGVSFTGTELPRLGQTVENRVVGAPCGLMDQLATYFGEPGKLLPILCQPDQIQPLLPIPEGVRFVGIDSGAEHSVAGASYNDVRTATFMGYSIVARKSGATEEELAAARDSGNWSGLPYGGYLANVAPAEFEYNFSAKIIYRMSGRYLLDFYSVHLDPVTAVDREKFYHLLDCTRHPVYENFRVNQFRLLLQYLPFTADKAARKHCLQQLGELMYQSHVSYTACGLGHVRTEELVQMVRKNTGKGVYGAKITGGGGGGTVCILCDGEQGLETARAIHREYQEKYQLASVFFE